MKRRWLALVLALSMTFSVCSVPAFAASSSGDASASSSSPAPEPEQKEENGKNSTSSDDSSKSDDAAPSEDDSKSDDAAPSEDDSKSDDAAPSEDDSKSDDAAPSEDDSKSDDAAPSEDDSKSDDAASSEDDSKSDDAAPSEDSSKSDDAAPSKDSSKSDDAAPSDDSKSDDAAPSKDNDKSDNSASSNDSGDAGKADGSSTPVATPVAPKAESTPDSEPVPNQSLQSVYLDTDKGDDTNAGDSKDAAVKTFSKAFALVKDDGTVNICSSFSLDGIAVVDLAGRELTLVGTPASAEDKCIISSKSDSNTDDFYGAIIAVKDTSADANGSLTIKNVTIENKNLSNVRCLKVISGTLVLGEDVILKGGSMADGNGGAVSVSGEDSALELRGALLIDNTAKQGGAVYVGDKAHLLLTDSTKIGDTDHPNVASNNGAGVYMSKGTFCVLGDSTEDANQPVIRYNTIGSGSAAAASNLYLEDSDILSFACDLSVKSSIGISGPAAITANAAKFATSGCTLTCLGSTTAKGGIFLNDSNSNAYAILSGGKLLWAKVLSTSAAITKGSCTTTQPAFLTAYCATVTANSYYDLPENVTVSIDGKTLTAPSKSDPGEYTYSKGVITIPAAAVTGTIAITGTCPAHEYKATQVKSSKGHGSLSAVKYKGQTRAAPTHSRDFKMTLTPASGYTLPASIKLKIAGNLAKENTDYSYNSETGKIVVKNSSIVGDVYVSFRCPLQTYVVAASVTGGALKATATTFTTASTYSATIVPNEGYVVPETVTVKADGAVLPADSYSYQSGVVSFSGAKAASDVTITADCPIGYKVYQKVNNGTLYGKATASTAKDYVATVKPDTGYGYPATAVVKVGNTILSTDSYTYDSATGTVTIPKSRINGIVIILAACSTSGSAATGGTASTGNASMPGGTLITSGTSNGDLLYGDSGSGSTYTADGTYVPYDGSYVDEDGNTVYYTNNADGTTSIVQTGDNLHLALIAVIMAAAASGIAAIILLRRKENHKKD